MTQTIAASLQGDVIAYLDEEVLPIAQKALVVHQFGTKYRIPKGRGTNIQFTRYNRLALPFAPLSEGVPAVALPLTIQTVVGTAQQWGGQVTITDVAELTIFHDPFQQAKRLIGFQIAETLERNDFLTLMGGTQVNYVNTRGSRANLVAGDVLDPFTVQRTQVALQDEGAPFFNGPMGEDIRKDIRQGGMRGGGADWKAAPQTNPHYVAVGRTMPLGDLRQNPIVTNAWSFSQVDSLYNSEAGFWSSIRFCSSNLVPFFVGVAAAGSPTAVNAGGTFPTGVAQFVQLTGVDTYAQYEQRVYQVNTSVTPASPNLTIQITTPNIAGFTFNAYVGTTASPANLALSPSGPTSGPMAGQAVQLPPNTTVNLTNVGLAQTPPAAPATGVTVYPTFIFGEGAFGVVELDSIEHFYLNQPEKVDPQNQLRVVAWKVFIGAILLNQQFLARIESTSAFSPTYG